MFVSSEFAPPQADADGFIHCPAPAKINLFLHVTGRRADGYHLLETAFQLIDLNDHLSFRLRQDGQIHRVSEIAGVPSEQDLIVRAARLLQAHSGSALGVDILVNKQLPMGGGLGGGSTDAATTLIALNHLWGCGLSRQALQDLALPLGADVPFFIYGETAWASGVGEAFSPLALPTTHYIVLKPPVAVPTAQIFSDKSLTRDTQARIITGFPGQQALEFIKSAKNDLQPVACRKYPEVQQALNLLQACSDACENDHQQARMSGSGACVFLPVKSAEQAVQVFARLQAKLKEFSAPWQAWSAKGLMQHPMYHWIAK